MSLEEFEKQVLEELELFKNDWLQAQKKFGTYEFPENMKIEEWWDYLYQYDRYTPYTSD